MMFAQPIPHNQVLEYHVLTAFDTSNLSCKISPCSKKRCSVDMIVMLYDL